MSVLPPEAASEAEYYLGAREDAMARTIMAEVPVTVSLSTKKKKDQTPQQIIDEFWTKFTTKAPGKATTVIPSNEYAERVARRSAKAIGTTTQASYDEAAAVCKDKVAKIVKECRRVNQKYRDPHFDLELDLKWGDKDTLESLYNRKGKKSEPGFQFHPKSVKRVTDVFDAPKFYIDGPTANDVRQGRDGDCWLLAALCTLSNKPSLIEQVCVARDEQVGVYGFVFHRDGEWTSVIIDDKLFLTKPDFDESVLERVLWEDRDRVDSEEQYRKAYQSGSGALYFAQCEHANETWLPLLEKAYAKAHGDYQAIEGGFTGEGIEDLTGGVTTELYTADILDKEHFWKEELMKVNDQFLFGCSTGMWKPIWGERRGIVELHAYSVMRAVEIDGQRLVLLKNPWGRYEWKGPWSDGSKEWTAEWLKKLDHRFGDDGNFWISYTDLLRKYQAFDRTRLFGDDWKVTQMWTTVSVPWTLDYHDTYFAFSLAKTGPVVIVLSQLDDRYYRGLEGQYRFELNFRLHKKDQEDYVVRSIAPYRHTRSINVELELEAGEYIVLMKINATRDLDILPVEEVIRNYARDRRDKLVAVGMSYDLAHSKGKPVETEEEKQAKKAAEKRKKDKELQELRKRIMETSHDDHYLMTKAYYKEKEKEKAKAKLRKKKAAKKLAAKKAKEAGKSSEPRDETPVPKSEIQVEITEPTAPVETPEASDAGSDPKPDPQVTTPEESEAKKDEQSAPEETETKEDSSSEVKPEAPEVPDPPTAEGEQKAVEEQGTTTENEQKTAEGQKAPDSAPPEKQQEAEGEEEKTEDESSDDESDIQSVSEISDRELEIEWKKYTAAQAAARAAAATPAQPSLPAAQEEEDEFESNPWNAVATVGLRVYYKVTEEDKGKEIVKLRVVRPNLYAPKEEEGEDGKDKEDERDGRKSSMGLDVDDSSKDATLEGNREQRRKSIMSLVSGDA
ncbi:hypothetical protein GQX73_g9765 [Xylaria multiplex]|uniref:Calpain catalytic domain-containing protein n=1 Tax=Xylaria multiplex TaxID=323545 RepID=A0A7C8IU11_9PEZI|nr:hypothetical protein GQX73_g9765 [Xylaria multiplex]